MQGMPERIIVWTRTSKIIVQVESQRLYNSRFRTVISLIHDGEEHLFEGILYGKIVRERKGLEDLVMIHFIPDGK